MQRKIVFFAIFISIYLIGTDNLCAQVDTAWVRRFSGNAEGDDWPFSITVDNQSNVYVTGSCWDSITAENIATVKYNANGVLQWVARYHSPGGGNDRGHAIALDNQNNVYVTGYGYDPYSVDYVTIKYNNAGQEQWVNRYGYPAIQNSDVATAIVVDNLGNVYVTGYSVGYFTGFDYATIKYSSSGQELWVSRYNSPDSADDFAYAIAVDNFGNVYVTGTSFSNDSNNYDYLTVKYNSAGQEQWTRRFSSPGAYEDCAYAIEVDNSGNAIVTGRAYWAPDYLTIKYNANGDTVWTRRYMGPAGADIANALAIDNYGNSYVTGISQSSTSSDYLTIKYNANGEQQWIASYNGLSYASIDEAVAIALDNNNNVYVTGKSNSAFYDDFATVKYNSAGQQQWAIRYDGPANSVDQASAIALDNQNNVYVTGRSRGINLYYDYATIKYVQTSGIEESEIASLPHAMTNRIKIYPNLARSDFTIRLPLSADRSEIKIFDVTGKLVKEVGDCHADARNDNTVRVSLDGIKNGVYFVKAGKDMKKLIVTK